MRGTIKRAKVHLIHKFTRSVKLLQNSKGKDEKKAKCQRKAERFVKKIKHIKEVEADDVSRFALSTKTEDVEKLLADVKIPMKSQAMAIITRQKFVAASIEEFRQKFPDWNKIVPSLLKKKKKKRGLNVEGLISGDNIKSQKDSRRVNHDDDVEEECSDEENEKFDSEKDGKIEVSDDDGEEKSATSNSENEDENGVIHSEGEILNSNEGEGSGNEFKKGNEDEDEEEESDRENEIENILESQGENSELSSSNEEFQDNSKVDVKIPLVKNTAVKNLKRQLDLPKHQPVSKKLSKATVINQRKSDIVVKNNDVDEESVKCSPLKKSLKPRVVKEKPKVVDPFFMTTTNEEYLTSQVPKVSDDKESNCKSNSDDFNQTRFDKFSKFTNRNIWNSREDNWKRNKFSNREPQNNQKPFAPRSDKASINNESVPFNIFTNRKERRKALQQPPPETKVEKLHPSWEAKKKQASIASFQGKKITFD